MAQYSAVVLDEKSRNLISKYYPCPDGWAWICHHMTICYPGNLPEKYRHLKGTEYELLVVEYGLSDMAFALKVNDGGLSLNPIPHITLAINKKNGASARMSNDITEWKKVDTRFKITGIVEEL